MGPRPEWLQLAVVRPSRMLDAATCRACLFVDSTTVLMASLASVAIDLLADPEGSYSVQRVLLGALWIAAAILTRLIVGRASVCSGPAIGKHPTPSGHERNSPQHVPAPSLSACWVAGLAAVTAAPLAIEPILRIWLGEGRPLEIQLLLGLRNLALALAALSVWPHCARLSAAASLCLMLFAQVIDEGKSSTWLLLPFAVAGGSWLLVSYQASFTNLVTAKGESRAISVHTTPRVPWRGLTYLSLLVIGLAGIWAFGPKARLLVLGEWLGSSGGTGANDPYARGGVNDGLEEVGGENPETTGFAETDKFLDSDQPTLYDAASDLYGEPVRKIKKQQERMISVTPSDVREIKNHAENKRASREFAAARKSPKRPRNRPEDRDAQALFEVQGRTPLHLRMDVFVHYDGATWQALANEPCPDQIEQVGLGTEMRLVNYKPGDFYGPTEAHKLKIASLRGGLAPTPTLLSQFRVGLIDRVDFFEWRRDGVLGFKGRSAIPSGTTVHTHSRTTDLSSLDSGIIACDDQFVSATNLSTPPVSQQAYREIAQQWAGDQPRGARQVATIIKKLREEYSCDFNEGITTTEGDPVLQFLQSNKSGPDYLLASAAVLLLRSEGYSARLALGYYASPAAFDNWTRHTPVRETDMHFWPEILLADGNWLALEPTPGYEVLLPQPTFVERIANAGKWLMQFSMRHPFMVSASIVCLLCLAIYRRELADAFWLARLRLFPAKDWRRQVLATMQLIESRAAASGYGRAPHQSLAAWSTRCLTSAEDAVVLRTLVSLAQAAAYGPPQTVRDFAAVCRSAERSWTMKRFRQSARREASVSPPPSGNFKPSTTLAAST
jgi:hypothetical protein